MSTSNECILSINLGSSTLKFAVFTISDGSIDETFRESMEIESISASIQRAAQLIEDRVERDRIKIISHRLVHSGDVRSAPAELTPSEIQRLHSIAELAPLHLPRSLEAIEIFQREFPHALQIGVFDTAFHSQLPKRASTLPLPIELREAGIRRYGFHGLSFQSAMSRLELVELNPALRSRVVIAHLGSGSSVAAVLNGESIDTTMSFSPLGGIMMGTRPGDLDPGVPLYLLHYKGLAIEKVLGLLTKKSGLAGICGTSDMREIVALVNSNNVDAALALEMFEYQIAKQVGAYSVALGGLDTLIFTGGIGEHAAIVRKLVCDRLSWLGLKLDEEANLANRDIVSADNSLIKVRVIGADEERVLAEEAIVFLKQ